MKFLLIQSPLPQIPAAVPSYPHSKNGVILSYNFGDPLGVCIASELETISGLQSDV
jgi:hypothetical protein